jgi:hypothetical protein
MTYEESAALMQDVTFRGRVKVAILKYSGFIQIEPPETMAHNSRYRWAQSAAQQPDMTAQQLQPMVVMDPQVQLEGAAVEDAELQLAVEGVVNKII